MEVDAVHVNYGEIDLPNLYKETMVDAIEAFDLIISGAVSIAPLLDGEFPLEQVDLVLEKMIAPEVVNMVITPEIRIQVNFIDRPVLS